MLNNNSVPTSLLKFWALATQARLREAMPSYIKNVLSLWEVLRLRQSKTTGCRVKQWHEIWSKKFWEELTAYYPWYGKDRKENDASHNYIVACVFVTAVNFLLRSYLPTIRDFHQAVA
jgi:hypothetical protein